jgi:hypothetical protein
MIEAHKIESFEPSPFSNTVSVFPLLIIKTFVISQTLKWGIGMNKLGIL